jgi:hypothetical protein
VKRAWAWVDRIKIEAPSAFNLMKDRVTKSELLSFRYESKECFLEVNIDKRS